MFLSSSRVRVLSSVHSPPNKAAVQGGICPAPLLLRQWLQEHPEKLLHQKVHACVAKLKERFEVLWFLGLSLASAGPFVVWVGRVGGTPVFDIHLQTLRRRLLDAVLGGMVAKKREAKTSQPFLGARTVMLEKGGSS